MQNQASIVFFFLVLACSYATPNPLYSSSMMSSNITEDRFPISFPRRPAMAGSHMQAVQPVEQSLSSSAQNIWYESCFSYLRLMSQ